MRPLDLAAEQTAAFVLANLPASPARILDVGCGNGLVAGRLQARGHQLVAIDESAEMVQEARALGLDARVAAWPSFEDQPFDLVLFARSLHHIHPLDGAVEQAYRLLAPSGLVIVEDFAWSEIDPLTAGWFYDVVRLLDSCQVLVPVEDSFALELLHSGGEFAFWQNYREHDLHSVTAMWSALRNHFQPLGETSVPHLYRYLCPVLAEDEAGYAIVSRVLEMEQRLAQSGAILPVGRRFVGIKAAGSYKTT